MSIKGDCNFKILLVGDSGVGKSCILNRFTADSFDENTTSTIGVDFKVKHITVDGKRCKLLVWDTAGQERFRTLTSSYYRGAHGIIFVYDVTRHETLDNLHTWINEFETFATIEDAVKMVVANKVDLDEERSVSCDEGHEFASRIGCLFLETSAKTNVAIHQAFEELVRKIFETPSLVSPCGGSNSLGAQTNNSTIHIAADTPAMTSSSCANSC